MGKFFLSLLFGCLCLILLYALLLVIGFFTTNPKRLYDKASNYHRFLVSSAAWIATKVMHLKIEVTGLEKMPQGRFELISNHRSAYDPIVTWNVFRKYQLAFISKPENFDIPFFGRMVRRCCFLPIDRENARNAARTLQAAVKLIQNDEASIMVYPEGTRSKDGKLLPFHSGVIKVAQKAEVPLVIVTVSGTENITKNYPWKNTKVYVDVVEVISAEALKGKRSTQLGDYAYKIMEQKLLER